MKAIPAIDILDGKVVRLLKGDYGSPETYASDLDQMMEMLIAAGFDLVHLVDLEGARSGKGTLAAQIKQWSPSIDIQSGGGVRTEEDIVELLYAGVKRIILGSIAARSPELVVSWGEKYGPDRFVLAADSLDGKVAIGGWISTTVWTSTAFIKAYLENGFRSFLCTDISKDGTMEGPSLQWYRSLRQTFPDAELIASGGVSAYADLESLEEIGMDSVVIGKAWLEGKIPLEQLKNFH